MKKILFCNIPMTNNTDKHIYSSEDKSISASKTPDYYPVSAFLERNLKHGDELKVVLLAKQDEYGQFKCNIDKCIEEMNAVSELTGAQLRYKVIETRFSEDQSTHDGLLSMIVDELEEKAHILADITYGPKDLPLVLFTAMNFSEKFLGCEIDNILYVQAVFSNGLVVSTRICDMIPLYCLNSLTNTIQCSDPEDAKKILKALLSI